MIRELDTVVLTRNIKQYGLTEGDIGAVVNCNKDVNTYKVEFVTADGKTIAVLTLSENDIRLMKYREILHVRVLA